MDFPTRPNFSEYEPRLYSFWETEGFFTPKKDPSKKPFTILLPPPNANDPLHAGHGMYVIEDILCRYHRMKGDPTLFLPGTDHAGIETQYVFERKLAKEGKSRFDFDRATLYQMIKKYVEKNRGIAVQQLKRLGFSLDWTRETYTLDEKVIEVVFKTFEKLWQDGLICRAERLVSFCLRCGTGFSNLEIDHIQKDDKLYFLDYGALVVATVRPETIFADVAVAVHPKDKRYHKLIGKTARIPLIKRQIPIIADEAVDPDFGSGALKITPGHDFLDYEIGQRHNLKPLTVLDREGHLVNVPKIYQGLTIETARRQVIEDLQKEHLLKKQQTLSHTVAVCYRCKSLLEPLLTPQWYIKMKDRKKNLIKPAIKAVESGRVKLFPPRFKKELLNWLKNAPDWNISRQIIWGIRLPVWYKITATSKVKVWFKDKKNKLQQGLILSFLKKGIKLSEIEQGLQNILVPVGADEPKFVISLTKPGSDFLPETDTFDTWFSSGQWPIASLTAGSNPKFKVQSSKIADFEYFYPTSVLDTMWDILPFWVMRMLILGLYRTDKVPFEWVHLHSRVVDSKGRKMSKSLGNVIDPMEMIAKYGADALRFALVFGTAPASDIPLGEEKLIGARNFITKVWNVGRFVMTKCDLSEGKIKMQNVKLTAEDRKVLQRLNQTVQEVTEALGKFRFNQALESIYRFFWHEFADIYLEKVKSRLNYGDEAVKGVLLTVLENSLKLLHPFAPFVSEEIYQKLLMVKKDPSAAQSLMIAEWPRMENSKFKIQNSK